MGSIADELREKLRIHARKKRIRNILILCAAVIVVLLAVCVNIISDVTGADIKTAVTAEIAQGAGVSAASKALKKAGAVKHPLIFRMTASGTAVQPGPLTVEPGMSYKQIAALLAEKNRGVTKVVIPEGYEARQIIDAFVEKGVDRDEMTAAVNSRDYDFDFIKEIPDRENPLEGYLFPDTYHITENDSARDIVKMMLAEFEKTYDNAFAAQAKGLNMSMDEIVTLASIIERETDKSDERAKVAGVFYNRLKQGMKLQSCATVQYILKERKANLSVEDTRIQSPYNTYVNAGLPKGPIASPGKDCLMAALYPETTTALYFVMGKDGKHIFSDTYEQHLAAKKEAGL